MKGRCATCAHFNPKHASSAWQDTHGTCLAPEVTSRVWVTAEDSCGSFTKSARLPADLERLHAEGYPESPAWWCYL